MSYCLLLQGVDGSLRLLAEAPFATRNEALAALAREAESGSVDGASDQVWLIDLDSVAPVVLVARPAALETTAEAEEPEALDAVAVEEPEPIVTEPRTVTPVEPAWAAAAGVAAGAAVADAVADETDEAVDVAAETDDIPDAAEPAAAPVETDEDSISEPVESEPVELAVEDEQEPAASVESREEPETAEQALTSVFDLNAPDETESLPEPDAISEGPEPAPADSILEDLVVPEPEPEAPGEDSFSDLREALERSAAQMAAEGIVVPSAPVLETIETPTEEPAEGQASSLDGELEQLLAEERAAEELPTEESSDDASAVEEPESAADMPITSATPAEWPWAATLPAVDASEPKDQGTSEQQEPAPGEPTPDVTAEAELSADRQEDTSVETPSGVTLSDVDAGPSEPMSVTSGEDTDISFAGSGEDYVNLPEPERPDAADQPEEAEAPEESLAPESSAYTTDSESVVTPLSVSAPGYTPASQGVGDMTCGDCVWVDTCPNKDQRDPASCGSFQWK